MFITRRQARAIVDEMRTSIPYPINIMDESGIILASTDRERQGQLHHGAARIIREGLPGLTVLADDPAAGVRRGINLPITMDGDVVGVIGVTGDPAEVSVFGDIIKRMTEIMVEGIRRREQSDLLDRAKGLFVENWLFSPAPDRKELEMRGRLLGLDVNAPYTVALLDLSEPEGSGPARAEDLSEMRSSRILGMIRGHLGDRDGHYCAVLRSRIIVLLCRTSRATARDTVTRLCRDIGSFYGLEVSAGLSSASRAPMDIRRCYLEAQTAQAVAAQTAGGRVVFYDQVSLEFIVRSIPAPIRSDLRQLIFASCTPEETEAFSQTILLYFEEDGDIGRCAGKLFVHRNTFQYRMEQVKKRTGYSLKAPKDAMLLYLAAQAGA